MPLLALEGVYQNGKIELKELPPAGLGRTRVVVTFLTDPAGPPTPAIPSPPQEPKDPKEPTDRREAATQRLLDSMRRVEQPR